jgi:hypothetical protein
MLQVTAISEENRDMFCPFCPRRPEVPDGPFSSDRPGLQERGTAAESSRFPGVASTFEERLYVAPGSPPPPRRRGTAPLQSLGDILEPDSQVAEVVVT